MENHKRTRRRIRSCPYMVKRKLEQITSKVNSKHSVNSVALSPIQKTLKIATTEASISKLSDCQAEIVEESKTRTKCKKLKQFNSQLESSNKHSCMNSPINKIRIVKGDNDGVNIVLNYGNVNASVTENETREETTSAFEPKLSSGDFSLHPNELIITELKGEIKSGQKHFPGSSSWKASCMEKDANDLLACLTKSKNVSVPNKHLNVNKLEDWISPYECITNNMSDILPQDLQNLTSKFGQAWIKNFFQQVDEGIKKPTLDFKAQSGKMEEDNQLGRCQVVTSVSTNKTLSLIPQTLSGASQKGARFAKKSRTDPVSRLVNYSKFNKVDHKQTGINTKPVELIHVSENFGKVKMIKSHITFNLPERETLKTKTRLSVEAKPGLGKNSEKLQSKSSRSGARKDAANATTKQATKLNKRGSKRRRKKESNLVNNGEDIIKLASSEVLKSFTQKENESLTITEPNQNNRQGGAEKQSEILLEHSPNINPNQCGHLLNHNSSHLDLQPTDYQRATASKLEIESILINFDSSNEEKSKKQPLEDYFVGLLGFRRLEQLILADDGPGYEVIIKFEPVELVYVPEDSEEVTENVPSTYVSENVALQTVAKNKLNLEEKSVLLQSESKLRINSQLDMKVVGREDTPKFDKRRNVRKTKLIARVDEEESTSKPTVVINPLNKHVIKATMNKSIVRRVKSEKLEGNDVPYSALKEHSYSLHYNYFLAQGLNLDAVKDKIAKKQKRRTQNKDKSIKNSLNEHVSHVLELKKFYVAIKRKHDVLNETARIIQIDEDTQHTTNDLDNINHMKIADLNETKSEKHTNEGSAKPIKNYATTHVKQIQTEGLQKTETEKKIQTNEGAVDAKEIGLMENYFAENVKQTKNVNLKRNKAKEQKQTNQDSAEGETILQHLKLTGSDRASHYSLYKKKVKEITRIPDPASATNSAADAESSNKFKVYKYSTPMDAPGNGFNKTNKKITVSFIEQ